MLKSILKQQQTNCVEFWHITPLKSVSPQAEFLIHKKLLALRGMKARGQYKIYQSPSKKSFVQRYRG